MTVVTGRRRIGKTSLILKATEGLPTVYLFVARKNESALCEEFIPLVSRALRVFVPGELKSFSSLFEYLMQLATGRAFNLIIDELQEFYTINPSVFSDLQRIWDLHRQETKMNLILSGSVYTLMHKIFQDRKEPLFGRADNILNLRPFDTDTLKTIIGDYRPGYNNDDLLALYAFTGGIPRYLELLCENTSLSRDDMIDFIARPDSPFTEEGRNLLIEEFGKNYGTYFSILGAIAGGRNTQPEIEAFLGDKSAGGYLKKLIEEYRLVVRKRPLMAKPGSRAIRYEIKDNFLKFWFNYFEKNRTLVEIRNFTALREIIRNDYPTYSGVILERYFKQKMEESQKFREIASYWEPKGDQNEIDIVALPLEKNTAVAAEVKRQRKNFKPDLLDKKIAHLKAKALPKYDITPICLTLEDM